MYISIQYNNNNNNNNNNNIYIYSLQTFKVLPIKTTEMTLRLAGRPTLGLCRPRPSRSGETGSYSPPKSRIELGYI